MKIMIHSNGPMVYSGYGRQTELAIAAFHSLGHDVAVSAFHGVVGSIVEWNGTPCYPAGRQPFGLDVLLPHADHFGADLIITLMDTYTLTPMLDHLRTSLQLAGAPAMACWTPVDCDPISQGDRLVLNCPQIIPLAMSRFGEQMMAEAGLVDVHYVPHSVNPLVYQPLYEVGLNLRQECGTRADAFVIGICAANKDLFRKSWQEQFAAFSYHLTHYPESELWVHTIADGRGSGGYNLREMAQHMGIAHRVRFSDEYAQIGGRLDDADMAIWYNAINLLSNCSYGEGFGLPIIEAQACGVPALGTECSTMMELATETVNGEPWWNAFHNAWWVRPNARDIARAYERYHNRWRDGTGEPPHVHQERVADFGVDRVANTYWKPFLDDVAARR